MMKKLLFPIIVALCFNAVAFAAQPVRTSSSMQSATQSLKMAQINQWNNMLPYAGAVLGVATITGLSYKYYKKYNKEHKHATAKQSESSYETKISAVTAALASLEVKSKDLKFFTEKLALVESNYSSGNRVDSNALAEMRAKIDSLSPTEADALGYRLSQYMRPLEQALLTADNHHGIRSTISNFNQELKRLEDRNAKDKERDTQRLAELQKAQSEEQVAVDSISLKKSIAQWTGIGCGIAVAGISLAKLYSWFNKK
jgi:Tfp pilus assembly major pilin PilA